MFQNSWQQVQTHQQQLNQLLNQSKKSYELTEVCIKEAVAEAEKRIERRIKDRFKHIQGYNPTTIGQQLGQPNDVITVNQFLNMTLSTKADVSEIKRLNDEKTNKMDTEQLMRAVDDLIKIQEGLAVVIIEIQKQACDRDDQTIVQRNVNQRKLYDQAVLIHQLIKRIEIDKYQQNESNWI